MMRIEYASRLFATALGSALLLATAPAEAANSVSAGELTVERPTLISAGFDWRITGDDNHNAKGEVQYRKKGEVAWHTGLPLLRAGGGGEIVGGPTGESNFSRYQVPNMLSGSIFYLTPDTDYEAKLTLSDPDGGGATKTVTFHTRKEPMPAAGGHVYNVYPADWKGAKQEPAFTGMMAAYYMSATSDDHQNIYELRVKPGDTILVHAGLYVGDQHHYLGGGPGMMGTNFDGTYYLTGNGTPDKPIVIKGAGDGEVIFDGNGAAVFFNLEAANYNYFEGITVRNADVAFLLGHKNIIGSSGFTLKHSKLYNVGRGVQDDWSGSKDIYIADNDINGRHDPVHMMGWIGPLWEKFPGYPELLSSEYGVKVYGQGNVVAYNHITNFHDGVDFATYGAPDGTHQDSLATSQEIRDRFPESNDFYGNDISEMGDNCIELDGSGRNNRAFGNRCFNLAEAALSVQAGYGGPNYYIRNVVYNSLMSGGLKFIENSAGIMFLNNTVIASGRAGPAQNMHFRNNLFVAIGDMDPVFTMTALANTNETDYDGFGPNPGKADAFEWNTPDFATRLDYEHPPVKRTFKSLADFTAATGQEKHGVLVNYDSFVHITPPNLSDPQHVYEPADFDFRLKPTSSAIDAGVELANITDGFAGRAPDLGAIELGQPMPHYGPR